MYICKICGKEYKNPLSFGGHVSSHNRTKKQKTKPKTNCKWCDKKYDNPLSLGGHQTTCNKNPNRQKTLLKIGDKHKGKSLSEEHKAKVSKGMKKAHAEGRAWNIGMSRWNNKPSYPEEFFMKVIENEFDDKNYIREYPIGKYSIDFAWIHLKKAIEIDGEQHQRFDEIKNRDKAKDLILEENGWEVLRIPWKDFYPDTKGKIKEIINFIDKPSKKYKRRYINKISNYEINR